MNELLLSLLGATVAIVGLGVELLGARAEKRRLELKADRAEAAADTARADAAALKERLERAVSLAKEATRLLVEERKASASRKAN